MASGGPSGSDAKMGADGMMGAPPGMVPPSEMMAGMPPQLPPIDFGPGSYDELHRKCKEVFPICFDGAKLMISKGLSNYFQVSHTLSLSQQANSYRFGATYIGQKHIAPQESYPIMLADTDLDRNMTATFIHSWTERIRTRIRSQVQKNAIQGFECCNEYRGRLQYAAITVANPDLVNEQGIIVGSYIRRVLPRLDLGVEMTYQYSKQIPGGQFSQLSYSARYSADKWTASGTVGKNAFHASYHHKHSDEFQMCVEWESNLRMQESVATIGYQMDLPKADVVFKASADTDWNVSATMEKRLQPMPFTLAISGMVNHTRAASKFGIGLIVGG